MTPTPRTDAESFLSRGMGIVCTLPKEAVVEFARTLERENAELNERLIDRQRTLMETLIENRNLKRELAKGNLAQILALRTAIEETLEANRGLADGDDCTLKALKDAVGWE